ncbi:MAG: hypothetical protein HWD61_05770 [Parachlamydiaceae bacterium]|nr:MAG: hypothetical protein HWD61_05770 [Parachlamydiaceae bacterium]
MTDKDILQLQGIMARERINDDLPVSMRLKMIQKPTHEKVLENPLWFDQILDSFEASLNKFASLNEEISNKNQLLLKYVLSAVLDDVDEALKSGEPVDKIKAECLSKFRSELLLTRADDEELNDPALMDVRKTLVSLPTANIAVNLLSKILDQEIDWPNTKS